MLDNLALNAICPYYTMFPLEFPLRALERVGQSRYWVLDPFCGRGTTNFAARLMNRPSVGIDSSPVAIAIGKAKLASVRPDAVVALARKILTAGTRHDMPRGAFWRLAFHPATLADICKLRSRLQQCSTDAQVVLRAICLGALHGPLQKESASYFSNQSPRTFAPKPAYAVRFWTQHSLTPPRVDVLEVISTRARRFLSPQLAKTEGTILLGDSRRQGIFGQLRRFGDVITSPPYYGMRTYISDQWLRHWFLGGPATVAYARPRAELSHHSAEAFVAQLATVWKNTAAVCVPGARLVARFGSIHDREFDPLSLLKASLETSGWRISTIRPAGSALDGKRQALQFRRVSRSARAEYDIHARLDLENTCPPL